MTRRTSVADEQKKAPIEKLGTMLFDKVGKAFKAKNFTMKNKSAVRVSSDISHSLPGNMSKGRTVSNTGTISHSTKIVHGVTPTNAQASPSARNIPLEMFASRLQTMKKRDQQLQEERNTADPA